MNDDEPITIVLTPSQMANEELVKAIRARGWIVVESKPLPMTDEP